MSDETSARNRPSCAARAAAGSSTGTRPGVQIVCSAGRTSTCRRSSCARPPTPTARRRASSFERDFGRTHIVAFGEVMNVDEMPALVAVDARRDRRARSPIGCSATRCTSSRSPPIRCGSDRASAPISWPKPSCWRARLSSMRVVVATTNDNLPALYFYQRRGYRLSAIATDSVIALTHQAFPGFAGIPVGTIRLEKNLG